MLPMTWYLLSGGGVSIAIEGSSTKADLEKKKIVDLLASLKKGAEAVGADVSVSTSDLCPVNRDMVNVEKVVPYPHKFSSGEAEDTPLPLKVRAKSHGPSEGEANRCRDMIKVNQTRIKIRDTLAEAVVKLEAKQYTEAEKGLESVLEMLPGAMQPAVTLSEEQEGSDFTDVTNVTGIAERLRGRLSRVAQRTRLLTEAVSFPPRAPCTMEGLNSAAVAYGMVAL